MNFAKVTARLNGLGSEKWAVHIEGKRRAALGTPMIFLSIGEPDAAPPSAILDEADRQMRAGRLRYAEGRGEASVRRALARLYTRQTGRTIHENQFIYLPGTQTALYAAMRTVVDDGDEVLMADPYYATYEGVVAAAGGITVPVKVDPDHGFHLKAADLENSSRPGPASSSSIRRPTPRARSSRGRRSRRSASSARNMISGSYRTRSMPP